MAIKDYSTTPDLNTQISGINIAEGCAPSGINNAIRQLMADVKAEKEAKDAEQAAKDAEQAAKDAEQDAAITTAQTAANNAASAAATAQTTANSKQDKLDYTPVKSVNGENADAAGNVALTLFTGTVTERSSRTTKGGWSITGLTIGKPLYVIMSATSATNARLKFTSGTNDGALGTNNYCLGYDGGNFVSTNVAVCIPTETTVVVSIGSIGGTITLRAYQ